MDDPYLANATADMDVWLLFERALCTCGDGFDPDCLFCADEESLEVRGDR